MTHTKHERAPASRGHGLPILQHCLVQTLNNESWKLQIHLEGVGVSDVLEVERNVALARRRHVDDLGRQRVWDLQQPRDTGRQIQLQAGTGCSRGTLLKAWHARVGPLPAQLTGACGQAQSSVHSRRGRGRQRF